MIRKIAIGAAISFACFGCGDLGSSSKCEVGTCSGHGTCSDAGGQIACECDQGYAGQNCEDCALGYEPDGNGGCAAAGSHPSGWAAPEVHGTAAKLGSRDCRTCHGGDLEGLQDQGGSCDQCHPTGWRTNCTFCHGGTVNQTGAPPVDLRGGTSKSVRTVGAHTAHVTGTNHLAYACDQCHLVPANVTSPGHMFDQTPGAAEVDMSQGQSPSGVYANGACSSLYCHGNGQSSNGSAASFTATIDRCDTCHGTPPSSGSHGRHSSYQCKQCHSEVAGDNNTITGAPMHVDGTKNVKLLRGTWSSQTRSCSQTCHSGTRSW